MTVLQPNDFQLTVGSDPSAAPDLSAVLTYDFPPAMLTRLQREQGWNTGLTLRALNEYRRFIVLAMTAPRPVTPSRQVDEVWHTHVLFTRDYWERLTPLLPRPLHHEPGDGSPGDDTHFAGQYEATLGLYRQTFGHPAPADLWPDPRRGDTARTPLLNGTLDQSGLRPTGSRPLPGWLSAGLSLVLSLALTALLLGRTTGLAALVIPFVVVFWGLSKLLSRVRLTRRAGESGSSGFVDGGLLGLGLSFDSAAGSADTCTPSDGSPGDSSCGDSGGSSCGSSCGSGCGGGGCGS
ncbi:glycine-rich domain-containing protein [Deinococcus sp. PESE-13]